MSCCLCHNFGCVRRRDSDIDQLMYTSLTLGEYHGLYSHVHTRVSLPSCGCNGRSSISMKRRHSMIAMIPVLQGSWLRNGCGNAQINDALRFRAKSMQCRGSNGLFVEFEYLDLHEFGDVRSLRPRSCVRSTRSGVMRKMRIWIKSSSVGRSPIARSQARRHRLHLRCSPKSFEQKATNRQHHKNDDNQPFQSAVPTIGRHSEDPFNEIHRWLLWSWLAPSCVGRSVACPYSASCFSSQSSSSSQQFSPHSLQQQQSPPSFWHLSQHRRFQSVYARTSSSLTGISGSSLLITSSQQRGHFSVAL